MRVVAMISGGKDSCYNMMQCVAEGHEIVALANLHPKNLDELDSYMYQTVGHMGIEILAKAMDKPLFRRETFGKSSQLGKIYEPTEDDEVEDLFSLLEQIKNDLHVEAVAVGAILSDYQRVRVENVCKRLNLKSLAYLWRRDQTELLQEMIDCHVHAVIIKVAALGLDPDHHLGKSLSKMQPHLLKMKETYGLNVCGEGGEYETFTLDCPLFKQRIVIEEMQVVASSRDPVCPVGYINFTKLSLAKKQNQYNCDIVKTSLDYISDLNESTYSDLSDPDLNESELELIEKETRMRESLSQNEIISRSNSFGRRLTTSSPVPIVTKSASVDEGCSGSLEDNTTTTPTTTTSISTNKQNIPITQPPSPIQYDRELRPLNNKAMVAINDKGWMWVAGIQGSGNNLIDGMESAMNQLEEIAIQNNYNLIEYCFITMYVRNINEYTEMNLIYGNKLNFQNPPTRVCVECPLPDNCHIILEAVAFKETIDTNELTTKRNTMHVQGISHWAPANIGPYSQSIKIGDITYISGQIALVPGSMTIIEGGIRPQCKLTLRHISRIAIAMNAQGQLRDVVQGICFVTHPIYITEARRQWERRTANAIVDYIVVPSLPKNALVEWQVWAHTHNDRFEYEETGCSISDYTISIRRRYNYENNCAAIVCYVSTGLARSITHLTNIADDVVNNHCQLAQKLTANNFNEILLYVINKLLQDYPDNYKKTDIDNIEQKTNIQLTEEALTTIDYISNNKNLNSVNNTSYGINKQDTKNLKKHQAIHLKVFYQITATPSIELLLDTLNEFKLKINDTTVNIAFTVIPACSLQNFSTFLSICGIRHE